MLSVLCVGAGGFAGAVLRYGASLAVPESAFPVATFAVNVLGSFVMGLVVGAVDARPGMLSPNMVLFLKTGLCGGFTTFSTFSLETLGLFEEGAWLLGGAYAAASLVCCVVGVFCGRAVALHLLEA